MPGFGYVTKFGQRIKDMGYQFMLDFHYSDTWADPGKQFMPDCWLDAETAHCLTVCTDTLKTPFGLWWKPVHVPI